MGVNCKSLMFGSTLKIFTSFEIMLGIVITFFCKLVSFSNPCGEAHLSHLFSQCIHCYIHQLLNLSVVAMGTEVDVEKAIKLEMEGIFGKVITSAM